MSWRRMRVLATAAFCLVMMALAAGVGDRASATGAASSTPAATGGLSLAAQSPTVSGTTPFSLEVDVPASLGSPAALSLDATVYPALFTRTDFAQWVAGTAPSTDPLGSTGALPLTSLAGVVMGTVTRYRLAVGVDAGGTTPSLPINGSLIDLGCEGTCADGVYPVVVSLQRDGQSQSRFTTFLSYEGGPQPAPLKVALVLPVQAQRPTAGHGDQLSSSEVTALGSLVGAIVHYPVPDTVLPGPQTLQRLASSGSKGRSAVLALQLAAATPAVHQVLQQPYVPFDPATLAVSGLSGEMTRQLSRGQKVLSGFGINATPGPFVAQENLGGGTAQAMSTLHVNQLVLPATSLSFSSEKYTPANTFTLDLGRGSALQAASVDPGFLQLFSAHPANPALAAYQLVADLNLTYEEQPAVARGVVVAPPLNWHPSGVFADALLQALTPGSDPELQPVTLTNFFASVPNQSGTTGTAPPRLATSSTDPLPASFAATVKKDRQQLLAFSSAVQGGTATLEQLNDVLLASESAQLPVPSRRPALAAFKQRLGAQLDQIQLATDRTITLTSRTGALPVTLLSSAPYHVVGVLALSSDKLQFPQGALRQVVIDRSTTPVRVDVSARTSGDLPVAVSLVSPTGGLVMVKGELTVRSTATSLVGVVLTLIALAVLLVWWGRTSITRRRAKAAAEH